MTWAAARSGRPWRWTLGAAVLGAVVWRTGTGPFLAGLGSLDTTTLAWGTAITGVTTVAGAWRWHLVTTGLGVGIRMRPAVAACYRAQFLNTILPGGLVGDVHRGLLHGSRAGDLGRGLRAVAWERSAGQVVQGVLATFVLLVLPSPVRRAMPGMVAVSAVVLLAVLLAARGSSRGRGGSAGHVLRVARDDLRSGVLARRAWPGVSVASTVAVAGHVACFLVAARAVGVTTPLQTLLPLAMLVLVAAGLPLNVAGWGPREGMAGWAFAAAGLGAAQGVATAVAYGVMVFVASLPGALVLWNASGRVAGLSTSVNPSRPRRTGTVMGGGPRA